MVSNCPSCSTVNPEINRYCAECGKQMAQAAHTTQTTQTKAKRTSVAWLWLVVPVVVLVGSIIAIGVSSENTRKQNATATAQAMEYQRFLEAQAHATATAAQAQATATAQTQATATAVAQAQATATAQTQATATAVAQAQATATAQTQATATAVAQAQATATAIAIPTATASAIWSILAPLDSRARKVYGPYSSSLTQSSKTGVETYSSGVYLRDLLVDVVFTNPTVKAGQGWDYGLLFRDIGTGNEQYRLIVSSNSYWELTWGNAKSISTGNLPQMNTASSGTNRLVLYVNGANAYFYLNNQYIATLNTGEKMVSGSVKVASGLYSNNSTIGTTTKYANFTVYALN
ncbi:MAG: zinc ribbon domain-containing protein [Chloroflexi bacterium]|uniref:Zinc ribbon domain-containing protein n=1 Tax=Candidatus Chlorohelix allophototropha TaxID=3003348 RepID=A0A8T7M503_9CHLR|nr:zinc ribbon domain-containing protein [Chloroflexota bacterium]WJW69065.1 zinc ribbon domain-containing protein [Chloroflexota bacterium L227-S17]